MDETKPLELFDPQATWKRKTYTNFEARPLQVQVFKGGQLVYQQPTLQEIQKYCAEQVDTLWDEVKRFENPHNFYVDLTPPLRLKTSKPPGAAPKTRRHLSFAVCYRKKVEAGMIIGYNNKNPRCAFEYTADRSREVRDRA